MTEIKKILSMSLAVAGGIIIADVINKQIIQKMLK